MSHRHLCAAALVAGATALTAGAAQAQSALDKLQIHGYLTQAYGASDSMPLYGISRNGGTGDYRAAALQFRYEVGEQRNVVLQLSHRRLGTSALNATRSDVELDWAFYQRRYSGGTSLRIGRVPMPRGIFNEVRDVGTLLPFYRAPYTFYTESFETVDGAVVAHTLSLGKWSLEANAFGGGLDYTQQLASSGRVSVLKTRGETALGTQLWVGLPIQGVRLGGSAVRFTLSDFPADEKGGRAPSLVSAVSLDIDRDRFDVRAETERQRTNRFEYTAWYAQAGVKLHDMVSLNVQTEKADVQSPRVLPNGQLFLMRYKYAQDHAVGANLTFNANLLFRLEAHRARGFNFDEYRVQNGPAGRTNYFLASLATSF